MIIDNVNDKLLEKLLQLKSDKLKTSTKPPQPDEGQSGDVTIRRLENKLVLYGKFNSTWYKFAETEANSELKEVPQLKAQLSEGMPPTYSSGWKALDSGMTEITGNHLFNSIPVIHQVVFSPDSIFNTVYTLASMHKPHADTHLGGYSMKMTKVDFQLSRSTKDSNSGWGYYLNTNSTNGTLVKSSGYLKVNLWK